MTTSEEWFYEAFGRPDRVISSERLYDVIKMEKNVGGNDRTTRLVLGSVLGTVSLAALAGILGLAVGPLSTGVVAAVLGLIGLVLLVTGLTRQCVINRVLGLNTYTSEPAADIETDTATDTEEAEPVQSRKSV